MALAECQVQVRDLVMGPGTPYTVLPGFNPFVRSVRADQTGPRAWNHGSYSGAEWMDEAVITVPLSVAGSGRNIATWLPLHQALAAAFAPVGDTGETVGLHWVYGGVEYVMFGRPHGVRPHTDLIAVGKAVTECGFVAQDPRIYAGTESTAQTGLPTQSGGMTIPITVPFTVSGTLTGGSASMLNEGTTDTGLTLRIDGPVISPVMVVQQPGGDIQRIRFDLTLASGQWLDVDTAARTALLNGLPQANQRGRAVWDIDPYPIPPGMSTLRYLSGGYNATTHITATWRYAWW